MFDALPLALEELPQSDDASVVAAISGWARIEAAAAARRLAAIAELTARRAGAVTERELWSCDDWDATAAEVAAALRISHGKASGQMYLATALRNRLPKVAKLFAEGRLSAQLVSTISWHSALIKDPDALDRVDSALARDALRYGPMSATKTAQAIDAIIDEHDPGALRQTRASSRCRDLVVDTGASRHGTTPLWGRLYAHDATTLDRRLMQMAHEVCDDDPRTVAQRRADALGALAAGRDRLVCGCGGPHCPAASETAPSAGPAGVVIHVLADAATVDTPVDPHNSGEHPLPPSGFLRLTDPPLPEPDPPATTAPAALLLGGPVLPAPLLAELIRNGATIRPVRLPDPSAPPEPGYRPPARLAEFIRLRDLTCRFPGCDHPAEFCDIDHTIAYGEGGLTHPSNLKLLCRKHHLLKTFWTEWRDVQYPDGTVEWTSPTGRVYTTSPGSRLLFPRLCRPTGRLTASMSGPRTGGQRGLMMPLRKRPRWQDRAHRINVERNLNAAHVAERNEPPPF
ncbi:HNH endonuclease signature motif containing protein [Mycobacterium sp. 1274756.6]|uniref:HNH endonuclease signature motif containing protein n=1 Tax=Mycobacterium sp. 1274756.6 TaxID=1834076 RepID=UPI0007FB951B|nr:HNH endonuclease signature motif containing protein [Mycobacterium sp. 1274756.6]OBJ67702.1 hypothetical protein A5643_16675 [Mycobacterium sp. 1274756.6]